MSAGSLLSQQDCMRLLDATQELAAASQLETIHAVALRWTRELTGADGAAFVMRDGDHVFYAADDAIAPLWKGCRFPIDACISGRCMTRGEAITIPNVLQEPGILTELYAPTFVKSLALVPIRRAAPVGALGAYWATRHVASDRELAVLERLAGGCAIAIANADRVTQLEAMRNEATRAHAAINDRRRWLRDLLGQAPAMINLLRGPDLVFEFAHPLAVQTLGGRQLEGKPVLEAVPEYAGQPFIETLREVYRTGKPYHGQGILAPIDRGNGQIEATYWDSVYLPTRTNGEIDGVMTFEVDVTERVRNARSVEQAEVQLREVEERLRLALVAADIGTWDLNPLTGVLRWDVRCKQLFGLPLDSDVTYATFLSGVHPEDRARTHEAVQRALAGERGGEYDIEHRTIGFVNDIERHVAARGKAYFDATGACVRFIGTIQDLTATKQSDQRRLLAERAAEQAGQRLRDLVMQSPIAMCVLVGPEHRYELANPRYHEMVGRDQLVGKTMLEAFPELAGSALLATTDRTYQTGEPFSSDEFPVTIVRGGVLEDCFFQFNLAPMRDAAGAITGAMVTAVEVTEQVQARRAVEQSEAKLRRIVDSNMVGFLFGRLDGRVTEANDYALRVLGVTRDQLPAVDLLAMTWPEDLEASRRAQAAIREHGLCAPFEKRYVRRDGSIVWVVVAAALLPGSADQNITFLLDISERKRSEQRLAQLTREAESANRAKDEFLAMLGHELRNPLAPIVTALQLMRLRGADLVERERTVIERQTQHLVRLVDDLLDISRITRGKIELKREPIEVVEVVAKAIEIASPLIEQRRHELDVHVPPHGHPVSADPARLAQVVANLLTNAAKYTEPGGRITITAARSGAEIELAVRDTGIGIAPEMLPRIFDLFVQEPQALDRSQGGLGLGLSIVKSLVELHGGTVRAESAGRGTGTTMTVRLPALEHAAVAPPRAAGPAYRTASEIGGSTVLVVDDNDDAAEMLATFLREMGHATRVARDGVEALQLVEQFEPELALLDIGLPVMDGYELAGRLRQRFPARSLRLVAVTGYGQESDRRRVFAAGFDGHLVKPVDVTRLQGLMRELAAATNR